MPYFTLFRVYSLRGKFRFYKIRFYRKYSIPLL
nr:MAG TPA: hypothetical protein [Caudoviricetes sp.]